ncbi:MAG TPA: hypothetical protein DEB39_05945 [Planctomycetaceae bacterium]|nr:hypothetical protein [Planctomycetaceae bacterium]
MLLGVLVSCFGCESSPQRPPGMPSLVRRAKITVTQAGRPLADAKIILVSEGNQVPWTVGGKTDQNGVARLVTHGQFPGAPEGKYKVVVTKLEKPDKSRLPGDSKSWSKDEEESARTFYDLVESEFGETSTTPLTVEILSSSYEATVDVGKPVRIKHVMSKGVP